MGIRIQAVDHHTTAVGGNRRVLHCSRGPDHTQHSAGSIKPGELRLPCPAGPVSQDAISRSGELTLETIADKIDLLGDRYRIAGSLRSTSIERLGQKSLLKPLPVLVTPVYA